MNGNILINGFSNDTAYLENTTPSYEDEKDSTKWVGKVIDNTDPMFLGRCKVRIFGYYDEAPVASIPWACHESSYVGSKNGTLVVPEIGTVVRGYFDNGDTQKPVYTNTITQLGALTSSPTSLDRVLDYPNTMVLLETEQGETLTLNRKNGLVSFSHRSGLSINISSNGSITIDQGTPMGLSTSKPTLDITINGKTNLTANDDIDIKSSKNVMVESVTGEIKLGNNPAKQLVCNLPNCLVTGAPHAVGNIQVKV